MTSVVMVAPAAALQLESWAFWNNFQNFQLPKTFLEGLLLGLIPQPLYPHIPISPHLQIPDLDLGIHCARPKNEPVWVELGTGESCGESGRIRHLGRLRKVGKI